MADEARDRSVGEMLDGIRRRDLLENNLSEDRRWLEVATSIADAPLRIQVRLPLNRWSSPRDLVACPPLALQYESRMSSWNLDYMMEAFDAIYARHPGVTGPWVTVIRAQDRRTYDGHDAWEMAMVASMFRPQRGLKAARGRGVPPEGVGTPGDEVERVEIHTELSAGPGMRRTDTTLEFHRDEGGFTEVVRFGGTGSTPCSPELLRRILENVLWGGAPDPADVDALREQVQDLMVLFADEAA